MAIAKQFDFLLVGLRDPATDEVLAAGTVETYTAVGTFATGKVAYKTASTTGANWGAAITLDAYGRAQAWGDGQYDMIVKNSAGTVVYTLEGYDGQYSGVSAATKLDAASPTLTSGNLNMSTTGKIVNLATPTAATDGVTKAYADKAGVIASAARRAFDAASGTGPLVTDTSTVAGLSDTAYSSVIDIIGGATERVVGMRLVRPKGSANWIGYAYGIDANTNEFNVVAVNSADPTANITLNGVLVTLIAVTDTDISGSIEFASAVAGRYVAVYAYVLGNS